MIISISGDLGSGKSTLAKNLAEKLNWPRYYMGGLRRKKAQERGMTLAEYNKLGEIDISTDIEVDEYQKKLGETDDNFIIEGRTSWYFIPHSLKLYISVDEQEGANRIFEHLKTDVKRNEDIGLDTIQDVLISNQKRRQSDTKRYKKYFNIDVYDHKNYDHIVDTTNLTIEEAFNKVYSYIEKKLKEIK